MLRINNFGTKGLGYIDAAVVKDHVVLGGKVRGALDYGLTPLSILMERGLEALEKIRVVDGESGECKG
jgi:hypothetical protein